MCAHTAVVGTCYWWANAMKMKQEDREFKVSLD